MPRPKKGTKAGDLATKKWRETMEKKYGGVTEYAKRIGSIGGRKSHGGGFTNREFARKMGALGGLISKRSKSKKNEWLACKDEALKMYHSGEYSIADIARKYHLEYSTTRYYIRKENE